MTTPQLRSAADKIKLLSDPTRFLIVEMLADGPKTVGELADGTHTQTRAALSQHITILRASGAIFGKRGRTSVYDLGDLGRSLVEIVRAFKPAA